MKLPGPLTALSTGELRSGAEFPRFLAGLGDALERGLPGVLVREPQLATGDLLALVEEVVALCQMHGEAWCGVHDRLHVALAAGADGVHLGFRSLKPAVVKELVGERLAIGFSAHVGDTPAEWDGANYLFYGPVFSTPSKEGLVEPVGIGGLESFLGRAELAEAALELHGLGGLTPERASSVAASGAGVAVLSGILGASDPGAATSRFLEAIAGAP